MYAGDPRAEHQRIDSQYLSTYDATMATGGACSSGWDQGDGGSQLQWEGWWYPRLIGRGGVAMDQWITNGEKDAFPTMLR